MTKKAPCCVFVYIDTVIFILRCINLNLIDCDMSLNKIIKGLLVARGFWQLTKKDQGAVSQLTIFRPRGFWSGDNFLTKGFLVR